MVRCFSLTRADRLWGPSSLLFNGCRGLLTGGVGEKGLRREAIHLHRMPRLRIGGAIVPLPCVFMPCTETALPSESHAVGGDHIRAKTSYGRLLHSFMKQFATLPTVCYCTVNLFIKKNYTVTKLLQP